MLHKFYNVNQISSTKMEVLKSKKIKKISTKMDGSLLGFYQLPNDKLYPMTKGSFKNEVLDQVDVYLSQNKNIIEFVKTMFEKKLYPLFEWVSPKNRIVLFYEDESLTLLQVRDEFGNYIDLDEINDILKKYKIEKTKYWNKENLETLLSIRENIKDFEGWVIEFEDGDIVKLKTDEYFELHKTLSGLNTKSIFEIIINDDLDDYKDKLTESGNMFVPYKKSVILQMEKNIQKHILSTINKIENIILEEKTLSLKDFALKYIDYSYFPVLIRVKRDEGVNKYNLLKEFLLKRYKTIEAIESFLNDLGISF